MLVVPNIKIWGEVISNVIHRRLRRIDMEFPISYSDDIDHAEKVFFGIINNDERVLQAPEPNIRLNELGDSQSFLLCVRGLKPTTTGPSIGILNVR